MASDVRLAWGLQLTRYETKPLMGIFWDREHPKCCGNRAALRRLLFETRREARRFAYDCGAVPRPRVVRVRVTMEVLS